MNEINSVKIKDSNLMPTIAMRGLVVFPNIVMHFDVARDKSTEALKAALSGDRKIFLVTQKDILVENPTKKDLYTVGVVSEVRQVLKTPDGMTRVLVAGIYRAKLVEINSDEKYIISEISKMPVPKKPAKDNVEIVALIRALKEKFEQYCMDMPRMPKEMMASIMGENDPDKLFENIVFNIILSPYDKQQLLETTNSVVRLSMLLALVSREVEVLGIERSIQSEVKEQIDKSQREYYMREQLKVLQNQLGEDDTEEAYEYINKIHSLHLSAETQEKLEKEADKLLKMSPSSQEAFVVKNYLDTVLDLPWNKKSKDKLDIKKARAVLDKDHYGLSKVKDRILETLAVRALSPEIKGQIICLVGPPGIGKTSIGRSIAKALGRKYARVSLGGVKDESDIRGHRKTYIGAMPGRIITAVTAAGTNNPLILLDEIDKMSNDYRGDPSSAMLEVLDSEQNSEFRDHFIEVSFDLSNVLFVTTANTTETIAPPLLDRMEVIELTSYTREEKFHIAKEHLLTKQIKKNGLKSSQIKLSDSCIYDIIDSYTKEAGVRNLERVIASLCRKAAKEIVTGDSKKVTYTTDNVEKYLGARKYLEDEYTKENEVGVVNGLAWTQVGGVIMPLEVVAMTGKGNLELTGSLGDVMKESARIAVSYVRTVANKYKISEDFYKEKDIHIHAPEGAVPKDGPSAGVTLTTALVSALSGIPVRSDVAMTGEITLHGKVLPIGGLREKTMAAYKAGIKNIIIPYKNKADLDEVDDIVKASTNFIYASELSEVLDFVLVKEENKYDDFIECSDKRVKNSANVQ